MKQGKALSGDTVCAHCGTPFPAGAPEERFCCEGCAFVHRMIQKEGLDFFYELKGSEKLMPAGSVVMLPAQTAWAEEAQAMAESRAGGAVAETVLDLQGVTCMGCVWLIEALFKQREGAGRIFINAQRGEVRISWAAEQFSLPDFVNKAAAFGYQLGLRSGERNTGASDTSGLRLGLAGGLALNAMAFTLPRYLGMEESFQLARLFELIAAASATLSLLACGSYFITRAWTAARLGQIHIDAPISIGILAAWAGSVAGWMTGHKELLYFDFVATFIFLMLLGRRWQERSAASHRSRLLRSDPLTQMVRVETGGNATATRGVGELRKQDVFFIPPGGVNPVSALLLEKTGTLSLEWITGESEARVWGAGATLPPGAVNLGGQELKARAREGWEGSFLERLSADGGENRQSEAARRSGLWLKVYLGVVITLALAGGVWWAVRSGLSQGLQVMISVLVVSCPCALGVALPLAHELAVARLRRTGLFVRRSDLWPRLRGVRTVVFDKTGTLTMEAPALLNPGGLDLLVPSAREALSELVRGSRHPLSASLRQALTARGKMAEPDDHETEEHPGLGVVWKSADGAVWSLGKPGWVLSEEPSSFVDADSGTESWDVELRCDGVLVRGFHFSEAVRPDAAHEIGRLKGMGYKLRVLSGDRWEKVASLAKTLGIAEGGAHAGMTPEEKARWISSHAPDSLYIGDGANDSLAFDSALARGTPAIERGLLTEKADFYFLSRGIRPVRRLLSAGRNHTRVVRRAFLFALSYNAAVITMALVGAMTPLLAAVLMPLSSVVTLLIVSWEGRSRD